MLPTSLVYIEGACFRPKDDPGPLRAFYELALGPSFTGATQVSGERSATLMLLVPLLVTHSRTYWSSLSMRVA